MRYNEQLREKVYESITSVLPITLIVLFLSISIAPLTPGTLTLFLFGAMLLVIGMGFFTLGVDMSMIPMGEGIGVQLSKSKKIAIPLLVCFVLGVLITVAEPDLQVLARQVPAIPNLTLIFTVAVGVGFFLVLAQLRILFKIPLSYILIFFYGLIFVLSIFAPVDFIPVSFDSGGVTTGPVTVPFIMALGVGISAIRSDKRAADDSFGLVALCSIGPILAVLVLSMIYRPDVNAMSTGSEPIQIMDDTVQMWRAFMEEFPAYMKEIAISLLPIIVFFFLFQLISKDIQKRLLVKIVVGLLYTYAGLVLFLTGVNVGFMPAGNYLGQTIAGLPYRYILIPIGMLIGYFIVKAEPAVFVLTKQVEEITSGAISAKAMGTSLSIGVSVSIGMAMLRVLTGIPIMWFIIPGYAIALLLTFFVPKIFTAIAFDSGGVASGPMTATFLLPLAMGACEVTGGNIMTDAFGVVAMVAMTPLITIQILGVVFRVKESQAHKRAAVGADVAVLASGDMDIIEL